MKLPILITTPILCFSLSACNVGGIVTPTTRSTNGATVEIGAAASSSKVNGVTLSDMSTAAGFTTPGFDSRSNSADRYSSYGTTASGRMKTLLVATSGAATPMSLAAYSGSSTGILPPSGSATMTGRYVGFIGPTSGTEMDNTLTAYASGDASLTANFDTNMVSGAITNRLLNGGLATADLTLNNAAIAGGGTYAGSATGGVLTGTVTAVSGSYQGLLDAGGTETAGAVKMLYSDGGSSYAELGSFIAE